MIVALAAGSSAQAGGLRDCYLRADTGYGWSEDSDANATITDFGTVVSGSVSDGDLDDGWFGEVGIGCALFRSETAGASIKDAPITMSSDRGFRADVTIGYREELDFDGLATVPPATLPITVSGDIQTWTAMFNVYYDFGNFGGFTPYIGAGVGAAFHDIDVTFTNGTTVKLDDDETEFAWALMAGVSKEICDGLLLDIGYRFIDMGDVGTKHTTSNGGGNNCNGNCCGCPETFGLDLDDQAHELRVGLRMPLHHEEPPPEPLK
jgi:opacity protein-like surface antigen